MHRGQPMRLFLCRVVDERRDYDEGILVTKTTLTFTSSDFIRVKRHINASPRQLYEGGQAVH